MAELWLGLIWGMILVFSGLMKLITGEEGLAWGLFPVPAWSGWIFVPVGLAICILSIHALRSGKKKNTGCTDEEAAKAEAELDALYLREHGKPPEKNQKDS